MDVFNTNLCSLGISVLVQIRVAILLKCRRISLFWGFAAAARSRCSAVVWAMVKRASWFRRSFEHYCYLRIGHEPIHWVWLARKRSQIEVAATNLSMFRESSRADCKGEGRSGQQGVFRVESRSIDKSSEHRKDELRGGLYRSSRHHWRAREVNLHRPCQQNLMMTGMAHVRTFLTPSRGKSLRGSRRRPWPRLLRGRLERCEGEKEVSLNH